MIIDHFNQLLFEHYSFPSLLFCGGTYSWEVGVCDVYIVCTDAYQSDVS